MVINNSFPIQLVLHITWFFCKKFGYSLIPQLQSTLLVTNLSFFIIADVCFGCFFLLLVTKLLFLFFDGVKSLQFFHKMMRWDVCVKMHIFVWFLHYLLSSWVESTVMRSNDHCKSCVRYCCCLHTKFTA